jgi:hypothetical protein
MKERVNNLNTIEAIAERCGVEVQLSTEAGRRVILLHGRSKTSRMCWGRSMAITSIGTGATLVTRHLTTCLMPPLWLSSIPTAPTGRRPATRNERDRHLRADRLRPNAR